MYCLRDEHESLRGSTFKMMCFREIYEGMVSVSYPHN